MRKKIENDSIILLYVSGFFPELMVFFIRVVNLLFKMKRNIKG